MAIVRKIRRRNKAAVAEKKLQLAEGRYYLIRGGKSSEVKVVGPVTRNPQGISSYPWMVESESQTYTDSGNVFTYRKSDDDLVREVAKPPLQVEAGAYYKTRGGEVVGPMELDTSGSPGIYIWGADDEWWTEEGRFTQNGDHDYDLIERVAKPLQPKNYTTVGVRFLRGESLHKIYTYLVPRNHHLHLGQEVVVPSPVGNTIAVVVEIHTEPQDNNPDLDYKTVVGTINKF
jgi:hypothetical protein